MGPVRFLLLSGLATSSVVALGLAAVLVYGMEPIEFRWAVETDASKVARDGDPDAVPVFSPSCTPGVLDRPQVSFRSIGQFATEAVLALNNYDYLDWDEVLPEVLDRYFDPRARQVYLSAFSRSQLLRRIEANYFTVSALTVRPAIVVSLDETRGDGREWTVQVPVQLYYQTGARTVSGAKTSGRDTAVFTLRVVEQAPNPKNYRGIAVLDISSDATRSVALERL